MAILAWTLVLKRTRLWVSQTGVTLFGTLVGVIFEKISF